MIADRIMEMEETLKIIRDVWQENMHKPLLTLLCNACVHEGDLDHVIDLSLRENLKDHLEEIKQDKRRSELGCAK